MKEKLAQLIQMAIENAQAQNALPAFDIPEIIIERPKDPTHGDFACTAALGLARVARMAPAKIAAAIVAHLPQADFLDELSIAGPGFINIRLSQAWYTEQVQRVLDAGSTFGRV